MRSYLGLIPLSAKKRKKRNRMTLLCIIIAVFMVTGIFSMADVAVQCERIHVVNKHGYWHFQMMNISEDMMNVIAKDSSVKAFSRYDVANYNLDEEYYINGKKAVLCCCDEGYLDIIPQFDKNSYPKTSDGIIINESMKRIMDVQKGDSVKLSTPFGEKEMTVSGFIDDNWLDTKDACGAFVTVEEFRELTGTDASQTIGFVRLKNNRTARKTIEDIKSKYNLTDDNISVNTMILAVYGNSDDNYIVNLYYIAAILIVFVIAAGVLMIAGSISASVSERTSFYGMLRCIGASRKQVLRLVRFEALNWCKTAVPIGVILGTLGSWGLTAILRDISSEFADMPLFYISVIGIAAGVVSGIVTVWIAAAIPARKASKVSPIAAISGNTNESKNRKPIKNLSDKPDRKLGRTYALESKKSMFLISGSFALCIVVCLVFVSMVQLISLALPCLNDYAPDIEVYAENYAPTLDTNIISELNALPEVRNAFGRMHVQTEISGDKGVTDADFISYDDLQFEWAKKDVGKGNIKKAMEEDGFVVSLFDKSNPLEVGDRITVNGKTLTIAAVLTDSPFSASDIPAIICSEKVFESVLGESNYAVISVQMNKDYMDADQSIVRDVFPEGVILSDRRESNTETKATYYAFNITVYSFIFMLALISVINIINSISMSTQAKIKQFGVMRAIGLDNGGLRTMIASQGATYAIVGIVLGAVIGTPLHYLSYKALITAHFGNSWELPVPAILAILAVIVSATFIAVLLPVKRIESTSVTEVISEL